MNNHAELTLLLPLRRGGRSGWEHALETHA